MNQLNVLIYLFSLGIVLCLGEGNFAKYTSNNVAKQKSVKKFDSTFSYPGKYGADDDEREDKDDDISSEPAVAFPPVEENYPKYSNQKGYDYGSYPNNYKGISFKPYWKGAAKDKGVFEETDNPDMAQVLPLKMMEMMMMMKAMNELQDSKKNENSGFLSKFISDPKSFLTAAIVPLSIILVAVVPVLINYMMTGASLPLIQTTASNKDGRRMVDTDLFKNVLLKFEEVSRAIDNDECIQKTLCKVAWNSASPFGNHVRQAASAVAVLVKDDWITDLRVKNLVKGLKRGTCDNVCGKSASTPRDNINIKITKKN